MRQTRRRRLLLTPFTPKAIGGLDVWWRASAQNALWQTGRTSLAVADTDPVNQWDDLSGNKLDAAAGSAGALKLGIVNGLPVVRGGWYASGLGWRQGFTIFFVGAAPDNVGTREMVGCSATNGILWGISSGRPRLRVKDVTDIGTAATAIGTGFTLASASYDLNGRYEFYLLGKADGAGVNNVALSAASTLRIGIDASSFNAWGGDYAEIIKYGRILTPTEMRKVHVYLGAKYALSLAA